MMSYLNGHSSRPASSLGSAWSIAGCGIGVDHCDSALSDHLGVLVASDIPKNLYRHNLAFIVASSRLYCNRRPPEYDRDVSPEYRGMSSALDPA